MDVQESQSNWPEMRKTLGKPGFCSTGFKKLTERTGTELFGVFPVFLGSSKGTLIWLLGHGALFYAEPYCAANLTLAR